MKLKSQYSPPLNIVVAGTTKGGTTSLYYYLAKHPEVCVPRVKELRYFLPEDKELPRPAILRDCSTYLDAFPDLREGHTATLDVTPDYMYDESAMIQIFETLKQFKIIFLLRDPVDRFLSWHKFAIQIGAIPAETDEVEYIHMQGRSEEGARPGQAQALKSLEQGNYVRYLKNWFTLFDEKDIKVFFLENMEDSGAREIERLISFLGLSLNSEIGGELPKENVSRRARFTGIESAYRDAKRFASKKTVGRPWLRRILRGIYRSSLPLYQKLNVSVDLAVQSDLALIRSKLISYYEPCNRELREFLIAHGYDTAEMPRWLKVL